MRQARELTAAGSGRWPDIRSDEAVFCACESDLSSTLTVKCCGAPSAPQLRIENMDENGIEVAWEMSEEMADGDVSVCELCLNLSLIPNNVICFWIRN